MSKKEKRVAEEEKPVLENKDRAPPAEEETVTLSRSEYEELKRKAEERDRFFQQLQRTAADFENYRKRVTRDRPSWEKAKIRRFLQDLLPAADDLERIIAAVNDGMSVEEIRKVLGLLNDKVKKVFTDWKIETIPTDGTSFDPNLHEAIRQVETEDAPSGSILEVVRKGYTMDGTILRAAQVVVAENPNDGGEAEGEDEAGQGGSAADDGEKGEE